MTSVGKTTSRRRGLGWGLVILTPVLFLVAVEMAVRLLGVEPRGGPDASIPAWLDHGIVAKERAWMRMLASSPLDLKNYYKTYRWDRFLFYRLQPDLAIPLTDVTAPEAIRDRTRWVFRTNHAGYNTPEFDAAKSADTIRIVTLGDSSSFGWGVESTESYPRLLEAGLRAIATEAKVEVINLGVCGYSSLQGLILLRQEALALDPDVVVLSYGSNDYSLVPESFDAALRKNAGWAGALRAALHRSRAYEAYAGFLTTAMAQGRGSKSSTPGVLNVGPDRSRDNLKAMAAAVRESGAEPLFVTNCVPGDMAWAIVTAAEESDTPLLDTADLLAKVSAEMWAGTRYPEEMARIRALYPAAWLEDTPALSIYLTDMCHPNAAGHRAIAEALVPLVAPMMGRMLVKGQDARPGPNGVR